MMASSSILKDSAIFPFPFKYAPSTPSLNAVSPPFVDEIDFFRETRNFW
jgi:hypothetical protein